MDSIKITALTDIGANIMYTTLVPVVNMSGTPTTQKSTLQNVANLILTGAGGSYFAPAAQAINAQTVSNAAQPAITSVGTLTSLTVTGNIAAGNINGGNVVQANFYYGNGSFLTGITATANTGNITFSSANISTNLTNADIQIIGNGTGNVNIKSDTNLWEFRNSGALAVPGNLIFTGVGSSVNFEDGTVQNTAFTTAQANVLANAINWTTAPVSNTSTGTPGQAAYDAGGDLFVCVDTNTWAKFTGTLSW